jgi:RTX calcium-binding nonapeptide repeat (4 copies)
MRSIFLKSYWRGAVVAVGLLGAIAACSDKGSWTRSGGSDGDHGHALPAANAAAPGEDPLAGVTPESLKPLTTAPTFNSATGLLTIALAPGELGMVSMRVSDSYILVNGLSVSDSGTSTAATNTTVVSIAVTEPVGAPDGGGTLLTTEFIVDYTNGIFAKGLTGGTGGISLAFANSEPTLFGIKGSTVADTIVFGASGVSVGTVGTPIDAFPDITWSGGNGGAGTFVVSMGTGDDTWSAGGDTASGARFNNDAPGNAAAGYGAGVTVFGGLGNDTFAQGTASTPYETLYGGGQTGDTVDYSGRTNGVNVALSLPGIATLTSGNCAVFVDGGDAAALDAGPGGGCVTDEFDDVKNDVWVVSGGGGNDFLTASTTALVGGAGGADAGADAGHADAGDAGHPDAGDAGDAGHPDAGADAGHADAGADAGGAAAAKSLVFNGNAGNDTFTPYGGPYVMNGGAGDDVFVMGVDADANNPHGGGTINGGAGVDYADYSKRTTALSLTMDGATRSGAVGEGMLIGSDVENIHGGTGSDTINGNALDNVINGGPGADVMNGNGSGAFGDTVDYSDRAGPVWASIDGLPHSGTGTFTPVPGDSGHAFTNGTCAVPTGSEGDTIATDIQNLTGSAGSDCLFGQPTSFTCTGQVCQNTITGGPGSDMIFGYDDDDTLEGSGSPGDSNSDSNYLDCGASFANTGHDLGVTPPGYKANCQF